MSVPALALAPVLIDPSTGTGANVRTLNDELLDRAARDDYHAWLAGTAAAGGCVRPVRLHGTIRDINPATGEILRTLDTDQLPDKVLYTPCGDRRASVCPPCAETYRRDTYQLIRAGLTGGKTVPESVRTHPCVFATFTGRSARCRPRRKTDLCQHGRRLSCGQRHKDTDPALGRPLCPDCYDYAAAVVWNVHAPELWRRTTIAIRRQLAKTARAAGAGKVRLSYAKVAEFQARGLVHFHAIFRLDATTADGQLVPPALGAEQLLDAIQAAASTWFATVTHPARPGGWDIRWGAQLDTRTIALPAAGGQAANIAVASYLAKYATKSTEAVGTVSSRITAANVAFYGNPRSHRGGLIRAAWQLGSHTAPGFRALRRWAHMLGYRGHFATKSRRYSTTLRALRQARADYRRRQHPNTVPAGNDGRAAVITVTTLEWAGMGWRTTGDALLALSAAARAREHDQAARDEAQAA